jgi:hypothetical protein
MPLHEIIDHGAAAYSLTGIQRGKPGGQGRHSMLYNRGWQDNELGHEVVKTVFGGKR